MVFSHFAPRVGEVVQFLRAIKKIPTFPAGLEIDGLYRVSGNLAVIQKLRFAVNHGMNSPPNLAESDIFLNSVTRRTCPHISVLQTRRWT